MLISHFCNREPSVAEENDLTTKIRNIVCDSCVLVVLDDADDVKQLDVLGIQEKWFGEGSKIILTSRNTDVLRQSADHVNLYEAKELNPSDALELFSYHSLRMKPTEKFKKLAEQFVSLAGGLPLALEVFGSSLLDKRKLEEWEDTLKKFNKDRPPSLQRVLELSYEVLDDEEKCIFLDISCLFLQVEMSKEDAIDIFEGCGFKAVLAMDSLIKKSLLKITENNTLWMHDQIRDMGRQIVIEENKDPIIMPSRLWDFDDIRRCLRDKMVAKNLMVMNLHGCCSLKVIPDLSQHKNLKKLILERCVNLTKVHESIGNLTSLVLLNLRGCSSLCEFACHVRGLRFLEEFVLSGCSKLKRLPADISSMKSLVRFHLDETAIFELPESIHQLKELQFLNLSRCKLLNCLPECIGHLDSLKELYLNGSALAELPYSIGMMSSLELLSLTHCVSLTAIPHSIGNLRMLANLYLDGSAIIQLPDSISALSHLKYLSAGMCRSLTQLPASVEGLSSIIELQLNRTPLCELPDEIGSLKMIKKLEMFSCTSLKSLPGTLGNMWTLSVLVINNAAITNLPESIGMLENLVRLNLSNCKLLQCLPDSIGELKSLCRLQMVKTAVRKLPKSFGMLSNLRTLNMGKDPHLEPSTPNSLLTQDEPELVEFPTSFSGFSSLVELDACAWRFYGRIPDDFEKLSSLKILNLGNNNFCSLPCSLRGLSVLQKLLLPHCQKLESLPPLPSMLLEVNVADCVELASISDLSNLKRLQEMILTNCHKVIDVPGLECLMSLRRLFMGGCNASSSAFKRRMSKACLKKFNNLSFPGSRIPEWFSKEVHYSTLRNRAIKGVVIALVVSVQHELLDEMRAQLPSIVDIKARIVRQGKERLSTALYLMGVPKTTEDQIHLCRFRHYHPLVSMLRDGDKLQVFMPGVSGIELKGHGIHVVYEDEDDYDGSEHLVSENHLSLSEKLVRFIRSLEGE